MALGEKPLLLRLAVIAMPRHGVEGLESFHDAIHVHVVHEGGQQGVHHERHGGDEGEALFVPLQGDGDVVQRAAGRHVYVRGKVHPHRGASVA